MGKKKNPLLIPPELVSYVDYNVIGSKFGKALKKITPNSSKKKKRKNPIANPDYMGAAKHAQELSRKAMVSKSKELHLEAMKAQMDAYKLAPTGWQQDFHEKNARDHLYHSKNLKNPSSRSEEVDAAELSREWHGRENESSEEIEETESYVEFVAELAELEELGIITPDLATYQIYFPKNRPRVAAEDKNNLILVGGDQSLTNISEDIGVEKDGKKFVPLGYCYQIVYETDKHHLEGSNGVPESYEHYFCEEEYKKVLNSDDYKNSDDWFDDLMEDGVVVDCIEKQMLPLVVYNTTDKQLIFIGGVYTVETEGIKN